GNDVVAVALAHGLAIMVMVIALGHISGGHFNPAVTIAALFTRRISSMTAISYIAFQLAGATVAAALLYATVPNGSILLSRAVPDLGAGMSARNGTLLELVMTFLLVTVIFGAALDPRGRANNVAGLGIGL